MSALRTHPKKWLDDLLDLNSEWVEFSAILDEADYRAGDEVLTGLGYVSKKRVAIIAHNNLAGNGYISSRAAQKILKLMDSAEEMGIPLISLLASPGVSIKEGLLAGDGYARILKRTCELSGIVPQIAGIMGVNVGGPAYSATLQDLTVFNRLRSHMMVSAPNVVKSVLGEVSTLGDLGGSKIHAEITGLAHFVEENVKIQIQKIRSLVSFFPRHYLEEPPIFASVQPEAEYILPLDKQKSYDIRKFLRSILDGSELHEYNSDYGCSVVTLWGYLNGKAVGVVANNPEVLAGSLNVESSEKAARFIRLCDAYSIPVITFIDTPGFMPGVTEEQNGLLKSGARLCRAMQTRVPRMSVILRKNYGAAAIVLSQTTGWGGDLVMALENSSCAVMGFEAAQQAIYGVQNFSSSELEELKLKYQADYEDPKGAYQLGFIDQILPLANLRNSLIQYLDAFLEKRNKRQSDVRGIEP
jgi:propionyl-CoA carboxylase beta chain